eukprot:TRINITY_DN16454_c0_g3_i1.p2 TRINITY_DN16454_c0_g3~~TRINITY_DN16454_c0_g3_i1.p2  ORF type:complete len:174 (-),score=1.86 TRINITY_DN16454_c0_g3_i1:45-566(-)
MLHKITILFLLATRTWQRCTCGQRCCCKPIANKNQILSLSDQEIFDIGMNQGVENCFIQQGVLGTACALYVKSDIGDTRGERGYPKNKFCIGTGCVKAPDFPKSVKTCNYASQDYDKDINSLTGSFCTKKGIKNAAAMLRHAIRNDACNCEAGVCTFEHGRTYPIFGQGGHLM